MDRSIQPILVDGTDGLYNPRIRTEYSFILAFEACNNVVDGSINIVLTYTADQTYSFVLVFLESHGM